MKFFILSILKLVINFYLYLRNIYVSFLSSHLTYSKEKGLYIYNFYDKNKRYKTLYFLNHKDFRDFQLNPESQNESNLKIVQVALITDKEYLIDLTDHIRAFSYYFKDISGFPWKKVIDTVDYTKNKEEKSEDVKVYIQSTHYERTFSIKEIFCV
jgi:hypothetical protein